MANQTDIDNTNFELFIEQKRYQLLKTLLLNEEQQRIQQLETYVQDDEFRAEKIAKILPSAIEKTDTAQLDHALLQSVQNCVIGDIQHNPVLYADVLYPIIFPAIKKSIAEALKELTQYINQAIEQGLSLNRFMWKYESWRTGIPYREIVLHHTLAYRVEQVFLIHKESGLLLQHASVANVDQLRDGDAVSAMLTAIQDFIKDSFSVDTDDYLDKIEIGDYTVLLNRGPYAVLACVMKGIAPYSLQEKLQNSLHAIHQNYGTLLKNFDGDNSKLSIVETELQSCLLRERKQEISKVSKYYILMPITIIVLLLGYWYYDYWQFQQRINSYLTLLQQQTGTIITRQYEKQGKFIIEGLYDSLSKHPDKLIANSALKSDEIQSHWQSYQSFAPKLIKRRIEKILLPPSTIEIDVLANKLVIKGFAEQTWVEKFNSIAPIIAGINSIDSHGLKNYQDYIAEKIQLPATAQLEFNNGQLYIKGSAPIKWIKELPERIKHLPLIKEYHINELSIIEETELQDTINKIEALSIYFILSSTELLENQTGKITEVINLLNQAQSLSEQLNYSLQLDIIGHADGIGPSKQNKTLASDRANIILQQIDQQTPSINKTAMMQLAKDSNEDALQRRVDFSIKINK